MISRSPESGELRLGEVVEASTTQIIAQCYDLYTAPPLGSLVSCGMSDAAGGDGDMIYGIVCEVSTRSIDPGRRPIARGRDEDDEDAVYEANPQLSRLLSTEFNAMVVGHRRDGSLYRWLAPLPPRIHSFVLRLFRRRFEGVQLSAGLRPDTPVRAQCRN